MEYTTDNKIQLKRTYNVALLLNRDHVFTVDLDADDDLTIGATVIDTDSVGSDETLFSASHTFGAGETLPGR